MIEPSEGFRGLTDRAIEYEPGIELICVPGSGKIKLLSSRAHPITRTRFDARSDACGALSTGAFTHKGSDAAPAKLAVGSAPSL